MAEIVNLRLARKAKARTDKQKQAERNRAAFGRTAAEKKAATAERARQARELDGIRRGEEEGS